MPLTRYTDPVLEQWSVITRRPAGGRHAFLEVFLDDFPLTRSVRNWPTRLGKTLRL